MERFNFAKRLGEQLWREAEALRVTPAILESEGVADMGAVGKVYAAVDIGASSGRVIAARLNAEGRLELTEVYRFDNAQKRLRGHDCWDVEALYEQVEAGLAAVPGKMGTVPASVGIDTWGVDFVLLDAANQLVGDAVAYRDSRTQGVPEELEAELPFAELYAKTGIQFQQFNTVYQLAALKREHPEELARAERFLMIPDYLNWRLTGVQANEYTNATTTGLVNARTCTWDADILRRIGVSEKLFSRPLMPGASLGHLQLQVAERIGYDTEVILPATHDTGSAFLAVPAKDDSSVFISSGTWSLLGVESAEPVTSDAARVQNFTNEGGYQRRYRFLKNIMGLWINQSVRRELNGVDYVEGRTEHKALLDHKVDFDELRALCREAEPFEAHVDVQNDRFLAPDSMIGEIKRACADAGQPVPSTIGEVMRTVYTSLGACYDSAVRSLEELTGKTYTSVNIVGGGCQDYYLNQQMADACGLPVYAGPIEGTSIGNLIVQMIANGAFADLAEARACIAESFDVKRTDPRR